MNKIFITALAIAATSPFAIAQNAQAAGTTVYGGGSNCKVVYGGGEVCPPTIHFTIDKMVANPGQELKGKRLEDLTYTDNLSVNSQKFGVTEQIIYKITVKNTGSDKINKIDVTDTLPKEVDFKTGAGSYNNDTRNLTFTLSNLEAGKSVDYYITTQVAADRLASDKAVSCVVNNVRGVADNQDMRTDASEACIEKTAVTSKGGQPVPTVFAPSKTKTTPPTGPEALALIGLLPTGLAGYFLRKKSVSI
jgi:uncharacterized repeat protein (TIGR01451 family)